MVWQEWVPVAVGVIAILTAIGATIRYVIKNYLRQELHVIKHELQPNSGSSMKDQVTRLEATQKLIQKQQADHIMEQKEEEKRIEGRMDKIEQKIDRLFEIIIEKLGN
jgi:flagellar biosynthesis/type III secretory pathway M-ring protein FliF/YscJ